MTCRNPGNAWNHGLCGKSGDTMWDIAKHFYTTVEEICTLNELEIDQVTPGMPLLLVKKVEG